MKLSPFMRFLGVFLIFMVLCCTMVGFAVLVDNADLPPWIAFFTGGTLFAFSSILLGISALYFFFGYDNEEQDNETQESDADS